MNSNKKPVMKFCRGNQRSRFQRRGATAVEFAMVAPALFVVILCCAEFARLSMMRDLANNAAYETARFVIVEGADNDDAILMANQMLARLGTQNATITINDGEEIEPLTRTVTIEIVIPMEDNSFFFASIYEGKEIRSEVTLNTERYAGYYNSN